MRTKNRKNSERTATTESRENREKPERTEKAETRRGCACHWMKSLMRGEETGITVRGQHTKGEKKKAQKKSGGETGHRILDRK